MRTVTVTSILKLFILFMLVCQQVHSYCDVFTDTNGTTLNNHHPSNDPTWTAAGSSWPATALRVESNQLQITNVFVSGAGRASASSDDTSQVLYVNTTDVTFKKGPCVRMANSGTVSTGYCAFFNTITSGNYTSVRITKNGAFFADYSSLSYSDASDWTMKITASGTTTVTLHVYIGATDLGTQTDSSSAIASGSPGVAVLANGASAGFSNLDTWQDSAGCGGSTNYPISVTENLYLAAPIEISSVLGSYLRKPSEIGLPSEISSKVFAGFRQLSD